jgi:hypothetical protein
MRAAWVRGAPRMQIVPDEGAIRGNQRQSEAIRGNQRQSEAIRGNQRQSKDAMHPNRTTLHPSAIRGNQRRPEAIKGNQWTPCIQIVPLSIQAQRQRLSRRAAPPLHVGDACGRRPRRRCRCGWSCRGRRLENGDNHI